MTVTTADGYTYRAVLHSMDPWSDFAVVQVLDEETTTATAASSSSTVESSSSTAGSVGGGVSTKRTWKPVTIGRSQDLR